MDSSVLVALVDQEQIDHSYKCHLNDNRVGGLPVFGPNVFFDKISCASCSQSSAFILQISCPVDQSSSDRLLYFFACVNPKCTKKEYSIFRVITNSTPNSIVKNENLFEDEWDTSTNIDQELSLSLEENLNLQEKCSLNEECVYFNPHFISVFEEPNKEINLNKKERENLENLTKNCLEQQDGGESYEKHYSSAFINDKTNYRFYKRLQRCPEQIIRYSWCGQPLLSTCNAKVQPEPCQSCASPRVFELQLMPSLINTLSRIKQNNVTLDMEFETILIYTCGNNCNRKNIYQEQLFVFKETIEYNNLVLTN